MSLEPSRSPQAAITKGSLTEMQAISSTPLAFELARLLDIGGQVPRRAGRREGAGHGEQRDALAAEIVAARGRLRAVGGGDGQRHVGQAVAHLDGHGIVSFASVEAAR